MGLSVISSSEFRFLKNSISKALRSSSKSRQLNENPSAVLAASRGSICAVTVSGAWASAVWEGAAAEAAGFLFGSSAPSCTSLSARSPWKLSVPLFTASRNAGLYCMLMYVNSA